MVSKLGTREMYNQDYNQQCAVKYLGIQLSWWVVGVDPRTLMVACANAYGVNTPILVDFNL